MHFIVNTRVVLQIEATFRKFDQTGNEKLNLKEFSDMMGKRTENSKKKSVTQNKVEDNKP